MSNILLWSFIPAFPHHFLSLQGNVFKTVFFPLPRLSFSLSSLITSLPSSSHFPFSFFNFPPMPSVTPPLVTVIAVQLIWGGILCVCVSQSLFVCWPGLWLIRRQTLILPDRPVLQWQFAGLTQTRIETNTHAYTFNTSTYSLCYALSCLIESLIMELFLMLRMCSHMCLRVYLACRTYCIWWLSLTKLSVFLLHWQKACSCSVQGQRLRMNVCLPVSLFFPTSLCGGGAVKRPPYWKQLVMMG